MKKIISTLIIILIAFFSCTKNDDSVSVDAILGKWHYDKKMFYLDDGTEGVSLPDQCLSMSTIEFFKNGTFKVVSYIDENKDGICDQEPSNWEYANWAKIESKKYKFTSKIQGQEEEIFIVEINFPTNDIMVWIEEDVGIFNGEQFTGSVQYFIK